NGGTARLSPTVTVYSGTGSSTVHVTAGHDVNISGAGHTVVVWTSGAATLDGVAVSWPPPPPPPATLGGIVWLDRNGNGTPDAGDVGLSGWHILINGVDRATSDAYGNWSLSNLAPGTYTVQEVAQSGWTQTSVTAGYTVTAVSGVATWGLNFSNFQNV